MYLYVEIWIPIDPIIFSPSGTRTVCPFVMAYGIIIFFDPSDPM